MFKALPTVQFASSLRPARRNKSAAAHGVNSKSSNFQLEETTVERKTTAIPFHILITLLILLATGTAYAGTYNKPYKEEGIIDFISFKSGEIVVNDNGRRLATNYKVYNHKGKPVSAFELRKGRRVEVTIDTNNRVTSIRLLP